MSSPTYHSGCITITPPLTWAEINAGPDLVDARLVLDEQRTEDEHGYRHDVIAFAVEARTASEFTARHMPDEITALVDAHPTHEFTGHIECQGEEGDLWRYVVRGREVLTVTPRIVWDDDPR